MPDLEFSIIGDEGKQPASTKRVDVHTFKDVNGIHAGLTVITHPFLQTEPSTKFFFNPDFGIAMNQNVAFSGSPDRVHDGIDTTLYTASAVSGTKFTFNDSTHASQGIVTIVDYSIIDAGETVTLNGTIKTAGGTDWTAVTSNAATATSLASALDAISGFSASATGAVVTVLSDNGNDITQLVTSGEAGELIASAQSVETANASVNDTMQFAKGSDIDLNNFTAITLKIYVDKEWLTNDSIQLYGYDTDLGEEVGNRVGLQDFFSFGEFDEWHTIVIPLTDLGLNLATTVDAFRIQIVTKDGAQSPTFYLDKFQVEASGTPAVFSLNLDRGTKFYIEELTFTYKDAIDIQNNTGASVPDLSPNQILGLPALPIGFNITRSKKGKTLFTATIQTIGDHIASGALLNSPISDGTDTQITLRARFERALIITGDPDDTLTVQINDDMSGLTRFTVSARGGLETSGT